MPDEDAPDVAALVDDWPEEFTCPGCGVWLVVDDDYQKTSCEVCGTWFTKRQIIEQARAVKGDDDGE